ncbi:replication protein [Acinetobacter pseudolwoffii]|uniref:replication protein n=1 Tax=Acinetobacter pseudolwoffii TaxID=2053287 RepID=UPI002576EF2C|nr:replication protein [Acinetobacter pseudolwoffii]MDM1334719.1 replication protein [Acinetobacter pseudolwoffii]
MSKFIPNSFQVPTAFVDEVMSQISDVAAKLYLIICRKTRGWHKEVDSISLSQFQKISGKSRPTITKALAELIQVGLVVECESTVHGNSFKLNDDCAVGWMLKVPSKKSLLVKKFNHASKKSLLVLVKNLYTQKTLSKDTLQNKKINKKSKSESEKPKVEKPNAFDAKPVELPVNINRDLWIQFVDMRNSIRKPLTENAVNLLIKKLIGFGDQANQSLEASIIGSYQSVYPPKQQNPVQNQQPMQRRRFGNQVDPNQMRTVGESN